LPRSAFASVARRNETNPATFSLAATLLKRKVRVRTAWHGPGDVSPVGHAANVHLDLACPNFGIQEAREFTQAEQDVFPGCPELKDGYYFANDKPGLGIDLDEKLAAKFPIKDDPSFDMEWGNVRRRDGTVIKP